MARIITKILLLLVCFGADAQMAMFHAHNQMPQATALLLDTYTGASEAVSYRKLRTAYAGSCIRVQRLSDNATQDIGFVNNYLDTASLKTFVGSGDGILNRWYSQTTSGNFFQMTTGNERVYIVKAGSILYDGGKVTARNSDNSAVISVLNLSVASRFYQTLFAVVRVNTQNTVNYIAWSQNATFFGGLGIHGSSVTGWFGYDNVNVRTLTGKDLNRHLTYFSIRGGSLYIAKDGGAENNVGTFALTQLEATNIFGRGQTNTQMLGQAQEYVFFTSENSANKTGIESNINSYYSIY